MVFLKSRREIEKIRRAGQIVAEVFRHMEAAIVPGVSTLQLDRLAEQVITAHPGATAAFKGYGGFPNTLHFGQRPGGARDPRR